MERGLLSSKDLAPSYDDVVWMYLFQDFSGSETDRAAQRVAIRFGISSWPQHFLVDPRTLQLLGDTGRSLKSFRRAVDRVRLSKGAVSPSVQALAASDLIAAEIGGSHDVALANKHLGHADLVVRYRAIETLAEKSPKALVERSAELLLVPHDQTRFKVCQVLAKHGDASVAPALCALLTDPGVASRNPNVVRIRAVRALARCGTEDSLGSIKPYAASGVFFNGLTGQAIDAVVAIAARYPTAREEARRILRGGFPVPKSEHGERELRACKALAQRVHKALAKVTQKRVEFPAVYDVAGRALLIESW